MKQPYEIHSDFFKKMIALGWYENREIILDSLPHHLEELPDNVKKFLREIWYLTISYDALDRLIAESGLDHKLTGYRYNAGNELVEQREFGDDASLAAKPTTSTATKSASRER